MAWGLLALLAGLGYGWWKPRAPERTATLKAGFVAGAGVALLASAAGVVLGSHPLGLSAPDAPALLVAIVIMTILFTLGTAAGDWIAARTAHRAQRATRINETQGGT